MSTIYKDNLLFINNLNENSIISIKDSKFVLDSSYTSWIYSNKNLKEIIEVFKASFLHYLVLFKIDSSNLHISNLLKKSLDGLKNLINNKNFDENEKQEIKECSKILEKLFKQYIDIDENKT